MPVQHMKGQPAASTYVREKWVSKFPWTPCRKKLFRTFFIFGASEHKWSKTNDRTVSPFCAPHGQRFHGRPVVKYVCILAYNTLFLRFEIMFRKL